MSELLVPLAAGVVSVVGAIAGFVGFVSVASQAETDSEALNVSPFLTASLSAERKIKLIFEINYMEFMNF